MRFSDILTIIMLAALPLAQGCSAPPRLPLSDDIEAAWGEPVWGEAAEGLQCRLRPAGRTWQPGEVPIFRIDIRNRGKRTFALTPAHMQQLCHVQFDGAWHRWPSPVVIDSPVWELRPGAELDDVTVTLHEQLKIGVTPGRHIVRVAFIFEGVRIVSNAVGIESLPPNRAAP